MTEMQQPVVSFLVQGGENVQYLHECLYAIVSQSFIDLEILILDSGEHPGTTDFAQTCTREDERIRHLVLPHSNSPADNLNHGVQQARGDLIWVLSPADRLASSHALKECVTQFILNPRLGMAFCRVQAMDEQSTPYERYWPSKKNSDMPYQSTLYPGRVVFRQLLKRNIIPESSVIARKNCFLRAGGFQNGLGESTSWQNWLRFSLDWDIFFDPLPKVLVRKPRQAAEHVAGSSQPNASEALTETLSAYLLLEDYLKEHRYPAAYRHQAQFARLQFMRRKSLRMSLPDRLIRLYRQLTASGIHLNPLEN